MGIFDFLPFGKKQKKSNVAGAEVEIVIKRYMADRIPVEIANFTAVQVRDEAFNLQYEGDEGNFKEDVTVYRDKTIEFLNTKLELMKLKSQEDKLNKISDAMTKQQDRIQSIKSGKIQKEIEEEIKKISSDDEKKKKQEELIQINVIDEENKLEQLKVLEYCVKNEGEGSYEEMTMEGNRRISFAYIDGILYPIFHRSPTKNGKVITNYPDIGAKRKFFKTEQTLIDDERKEEMGNPFSKLFINFLRIVFIILFLANIFWSVKNAEWSQKNMQFTDDSYFGKLNQMAEGSSIKCAYYLSEVIPYIQNQMTDKNITIDSILNMSIKPPDSVRKI